MTINNFGSPSNLHRQEIYSPKWLIIADCAGSFSVHVTFSLSFEASVNAFS